MSKVISKDGTAIAFERAGKGPPLIVVDGALCYREVGPSRPLAAVLARDFTVFTYDRRGRGESGDTAPYSVDREVEDLDALIQEAGGSAFVYGGSSGAALALEAATRLSGIRKLALYEAPFIVDHTFPPMPKEYLTKLKALIAADRRSAAVRFFLKRIGVPWFVAALMRLIPEWPKLKAVAHTLVYDITLVREYQGGRPLPQGRWRSATTPTLVAVGGRSPVWMLNAMRELTTAVPHARHRVLEGQTHMVKPAVMAATLVDWFR